MTISRPARQLLRQDVGLQQPEAVRHSVLADHAAHGGAGFGGVRARDLDWFAAVCRVANGLKRLRIGAIGARPAAFNTVRYSEKILEANGISVEPLDLSEIFGRIERLKDEDADVQAKLRRHPRVRLHRRHPGRSADEDGEAGRGDRPLDEATTTCTSARCSAGRRWKNTSAWCPAR